MVEKGAKIVSPPNAAGVGGLVALVGPNVRNDGSISTTGGQTILASGLASWLALVEFPHRITLIRVEDALLEIGRCISGAAITRLTGKVVPAGF